jgi:hypothetical protein
MVLQSTSISLLSLNSVQAPVRGVVSMTVIPSLSFLAISATVTRITVTFVFKLNVIDQATYMQLLRSC